MVAVFAKPFPVPPAAGTPRPFQLISRLHEHREVHGFASVAVARERFEAFAAEPDLQAAFDSLEVDYRSSRPSTLGRLRTVLARRPLFDLERQDPAARLRAHERVRALVARVGACVFYCWGTDALQLVPPEWHGACAYDFIDAPCLAMERRVATDPTLSSVERLKLRIAIDAMRRWERYTLARVGAGVFNSTVDIAYLRRFHPDAPIAHVIDGSDADYFDPSGFPDGPDADHPADLVFFGAQAYPPNADAARFLINDIMPLVWSRRPDARAIVLGPEPPDDLRALDDGQRVRVTGGVPDIRPWLARAAVVVSPLRYGTGMKNKLQAGLLMRKAMVASTVTCEGFDHVRDGEHVLIADAAQPFADRVCDLLEDPARRARLGEAGQQVIRKHYSWGAAVAALEEAFDRCTPARV